METLLWSPAMALIFCRQLPEAAFLGLESEVHPVS